MASAVIEVNLNEVKQLATKLNALSLTDERAEKLLHSLGQEIVAQTEERFDEERDPEGSPWRKLTEAYAKRKMKKSRGGILVRERNMSDIISQVKGGASVIAGSCAEYADYHQNAKKKERRRRFLGLNTNNIAGLSDLIDDFMRGKN